MQFNKFIAKESSLEFKLFINDLLKNLGKITVKLIITFIIGLIISVFISSCYDFEIGYDSKLDFYSYSITGLFMFLVFFSDIWTIFYKRQLIEENPVLKMEAIDKKHMFSKYISKAKKYQSSIQLHKEQNSDLKNETIIEKYQEIYKGIHSRLVLICNYLYHFDYVSEKSLNKELQKEIDCKFNEIESLIKEMNRLDNLLVKINNDVNKKDVLSIKDFIDALEDLNDEE